MQHLQLPPGVASAALRSISLPDVATVEDLARILRLSRSTIRGHLRAGAIPGRKIGRRWLVSRPALLRWLAEPSSYPPGRPGLRLLPKDGEA